MQGEEAGDAAALQSLLRERDGLARRLVGIDAQLSLLVPARLDALDRRVADVEERLASLAGASTTDAVRTAGETAQRIPIVPLPVALGSAAAPTPVLIPRPQGAPPSAPPHGAPPMPTPPPPGAPPMPAPPPQDRPPLAVPKPLSGTLFARGDLEILDLPRPFSHAVGRVSLGDRLLVTGSTEGGFTQVIHLGQLRWVESAGLSQGPLGAVGAPPAQLQPPAPAPATQPAARPPEPPKPPMWTRPGFVPKVLALAGAGVTLIGVAFLLILAAQYGYFDELARTISAALLGAVLLGAAFLVRRRDPQNVGAPILAATGIAAGFLSVVAATVIYH